MISKFTDLCNLVLENVERTLKENAEEPVYAVPAEVDRDSLSGIARLVADFTDVKPATVDEIIEMIKNNVEGATDETAVDAIQQLVDTDTIKPVEPSIASDEEQGPSEGDIVTTVEEPVVDPAEVVASASEEEEEQESAPLVPSTPVASAEPEVADETDEENTFASKPVRGAISGGEEEEDMLDDDDEDDTPTSELLKRERMGQDNKAKARDKALRYILKQRGKSDAEIEQFLNKTRSAA
jgi:hypothetical protein